MGPGSQRRVGAVALKPGVAARVAAVRCLGRVVRGGAWSNRIVAAEAAALGEDDRRLVRRLLYGTLRRLSAIDSDLAGRIPRGLDRTETVVLDVLRIALGELTSPGGAHHAAVHSAVEAVRELGHARASGFVNGVLRAHLRDGGLHVESLPAAVRHGVEEWLIEDLEATLGPTGARAFLEASDTDAPRTGRVRPGAHMPAGAMDLGDGLVELAEGDVPADVVIQDVASASVVSALGDVRGLRVLDMAAAPGGKTLQVWDQDPALVVGMDVHPRRLERAADRLAKLGYGGPWMRADGRSLPFSSGSFDRVLLDAPCSGLGTLRRRPELRYRVTKAEIGRLAALQARMLDEALRVVRDGGIVVYSVCTVTRAETTDVVTPRGGQAVGLTRGASLGSGTLLTPHLDGTDGMFISMFRT